MITLVKRHLAAGVLAAAFGAVVSFAPTASAATISDSQLPGTLASQSGLGTIRSMDLTDFDRCQNQGDLATNVGTFRRISATPGSGSSVCGSPLAVQVKDETSPNLFGRFNPPDGIGRWVDSNDLERVDWVIDMDALDIGIPLRGVEFALIDAYDQGPSGALGASFFDLGVSDSDATWSIDSRDPNATVYWITILFNQPVTSTVISFNTRLNDGWGVANASIAPIPAPPAAMLAIGGFVLLIALRRRRRA